MIDFHDLAALRDQFMGSDTQSTGNPSALLQNMIQSLLVNEDENGFNGLFDPSGAGRINSEDLSFLLAKMQYSQQ